MNQPIPLNPKQYEPAVQLLKRIDFLKGISEEDLKGILGSLQYQQFGKDGKILFKGEISNRLFLVCRGSVDISTKNKGSLLHLATLKPPMYFGEISLLNPTSATATATAGEEGANVIILTHESFEALTQKIPDLRARIQKVIDGRIASNEKAKKSEEDDA